MVFSDENQPKEVTFLFAPPGVAWLCVVKNAPLTPSFHGRPPRAHDVFIPEASRSMKRHGIDVPWSGWQASAHNPPLSSASSLSTYGCAVSFLPIPVSKERRLAGNPYLWNIKSVFAQIM
jgi:hypothetical protein